MGSRPDYVRKKYAPLKDKTLRHALAHQIHREFPRIGGRRIRGLCAEMILEVVEQHRRARDSVAHGQVVWMAVRTEAPPRQHQRIADAELVPVVLDLSTVEDVEARLGRQSPKQRLAQKAIRLCHQAYEQGGLLSNCDLAELLSTDDSCISRVLVEHERESEKPVPRRATLHDVGTGVTHKALICRKRYVEGQEPHEVAKATYHSLEAVDRYLGQYDRVRHCRLQGLTASETAQALACSVALVEEYLAIDRELEGEG